MDEPDKIPSIGISYQIQTRPTRTLVLQAFVERDCAPETLNGVLDKLRDAAERQQAYEYIDDINKELKAAHVRAAKQAIMIEKIDDMIKREWDGSNRRGEVRLTELQKQKQREAYENAENIRLQIETMSADLATYEARIANGRMGSVRDGADAAGRPGQLG